MIRHEIRLFNLTPAYVTGGVGGGFRGHGVINLDHPRQNCAAGRARRESVHLSGKVVIRLAALAATLFGGAGPGASLWAESPPTIEQLRRIEEEGRNIALYFEALALARAEFEREAPAGAVTDNQVIVVRRDGWHVLFVTDADPRLVNDKPALVAEVVFNPNTTVIRTFRYVEEPRSLPPVAWEHLLAVESSSNAGAAADGAALPFDAAIFFEAGQSFRVYLLGSPEDGMIRFGGDFLLTVERNPISVSTIEPLHAATWPVALPAEGNNEPTAHSHLDGDLPTATDVARVMQWPALAPHLVLTPRYIFRIDADGTISYLGPNVPLDSGAEGVE